MPWQPRLLIGLVLLIGVSVSLAIPDEPKPAERPRYKSPLGLVVDEKGEKAYVALHTAGAVAEVDLKAGMVVREIPVGNGCYGVDRLGDALYVSCEADDEVAAIDLRKGAITKRWKVGQAPRGVAVVLESQEIRVACRDSLAIARISLRSGVVNLEAAEWSKVPTSTDVIKELKINEIEVKNPEEIQTRVSWPECFAHTNRKDGQKGGLLYSASHDDQPRFAYFDAVNLRGMLQLFRPVSETWVAHQKPKNSLPASQITQGWVFTNVLSVSQSNGYFMPKLVVLDEPNRAFADPSDILKISYSESESTVPNYLAVTSAGANLVLVLDEDHLKKHLKRSNDGIKYEESLTTNRNYVVAKLLTEANPRRMAISGDDKTLVVSNYLADSLTVIDTEKLQVVRHIPLGGPEPDAIRRGEILFNSGKMTFQGQFTCASCHPNGDQDGLNWDLERDGVGNFKNTRSLLGIKDTEPYGWHGSSPTLADRVRGTLRTLHRHEPTGTEVEDLAAYLESLPPPRPLPVKKEDKPAIARGKTLFENKARCADCHPAPTFQDGLSHDVGTGGPTDTQSRFDTPSLRGLPRTAPYLHDGRAATLADVFDKANPKKQHGAAHDLSKEELADLIAYLKSL